MELDFASNLFVCIIIMLVLLLGYGFVNLIGLGVMHVLDRRKGRKKWYIVRRCL